METSRNPRLGKESWLISGLLFFYFAVHLWFAAQGKEFWMDETDGIFYTLKNSLWQLVREGAPEGQGSRSPLLYIFDRILLLAWGDQPQLYWDLRFFFRILPVTWWSAVNVYLFLHLWKFFWTEKNIAYWLSALFAFAIAQFSYTNNFASYYAIESRAYSLWLAFSLLHFLAFWQIVRSQPRERGWGLYLFANLGLVLTTYAALTQIFLSAGLLLLDEIWRRRALKIGSRRQLKIAAILAACLLIGVYYFNKLDRMNFNPAPLSLYASSVLEVLLKAFHHHSYHPAFLSFPLLFLGVPLYWAKRSKDLALCCVHTLFLVLISFVLYYASTKKGGIFASRYVIYALPSLTFLYILGVVTLLTLVARAAERKLHRPLVMPLLVVFAVLDISGRPYTLYRGLPQDIRRFQERKSYELHDTPACAQEIPHDPWEFERVNNECRGITGTLPKNFYLPENQPKAP